ncbi:MAG: S8 family serine peptidase [Candidatus Thermoplasmatota archaeon]|nr:S8 family serine peptidase [Candidatus Thermoplasmatota archaeon]
MNNQQLKSIAKALVLAFVMAATTVHSAETAKPIAPLPPENRLFSPGMSPEELEAHRERMKTYPHFWTITVALTTRNARNPQPLSKEWQQRILEAAGIPLEYTQSSGDTHIFTPLKKITHSEAKEIAARIRALPGILFAEPPPVEMSIDLAVPTDPLYSSQRNLKDVSAAEATPHPERILSQPPDVLHLPSIETLGVALKNRDAMNPKPLSKEWQARVIEAAGVPLEYVRENGGDTHVFKLPKKMTFDEAEAIAARIRALPEIYYADPSIGGGEFAIPTDPLFSSQWNLKGVGGGANLPPAWDITTGTNTVVVAVIDSGVLPAHPELSGRVLPGYDFISDPTRANDSGGRDADPIDPGSWVTAAEAAGSCKETPSSWHGTRVASLIAANANNSIGIAGEDWQAKILPVRVIGKCTGGFGYDGNDLVAAIRWAAGYTVSGVTNPNPAKVINLSLGGQGACPTQIQAAIDDARKKGAVVVAAVGNAGAVGSQQPANCNGVIRVAAVDSKGGLASYSNRGESATLSAPGGDLTDPSLLYTAGDGGATTALNDGAVTGGQVGTSFAAPHVSGVAALMRAIKPEMSPPQIGAILANTTRNFPTGTSFDCDVITCGTGILDAGQAVSGAKSKVAAGGYHTVAAKADGSVVTWGRNSFGALGGGESSSLTRPYPGPALPGLSNVRDVAAGIWHVIALKGDGTVWGWGYNGNGMLGNGTTATQTTPVQASGLTDAVAIAAGDRHSLALKSDGTVWAWGLNASGQLGRGAGIYTDSLVPVQVSGLTDVIAIAAGGKRSMALKRDGTVWAWGLNANATSDTNATASPVPVQVPGLADIVAIESGGNTTGGAGTESDSSMAMAWDGRVYAWGYNNWGQLCQGDVVSKFLPKEITLPSPAVKISVAEYDTVMLLDDGSLMGCGSNFGGAMGDGTTTTRKSPSPVGSGLNNALDIEVGRDFTVAMGSNLSVQSWGWNSYGQLGDGSSGTTSNRLVPVQVHGAGNSGYFNTAYATSTSADLAVMLSDSPDPALVNANLTYDLQITNYGPNQATGVSAVLSLSSQASFVSATSGCSHANGLVSCSLASLNSASNASFQVVVKPTSAATLDATASVTSAVFDPDGSNDVAGTSTVASAATPTDGDVPIPAWALAALGAGLLGSMRRKAG